MAELTFIGAAGTVTGSKHLITTQGKHFLIDCGLFQGTADVVALNEQPLPIAPSEIEAVVVTHGHIDHIGYLPKLVRDGFTGPIYCTPVTAALIDIVLEDAVGLQRHLQKRGFQNERPQAPPLFYEEADVQATFRALRAVPLESDFTVCGATARFKYAAHIIGSAFVELNIEGKRWAFSGDIGRYGRPLLYDPAPIGAVDVLLCESTYGDRVHPPQPLEELRAVLIAGIKRGGAVVIPAFAVERTQDILLAIGTLQAQDPELANVPVHLDSPMAAKVDSLFERFPDAHRPIPADTPATPFGCDNLTVDITTEQSKLLNALEGPHIILSASGMAAGGRVLHHLHNNIPRADSTVVFVGFQGAGTLGFFLTHGAQTIKIFGDTLPVRAQVVSIQGYSAHADRNELGRWLATATTKPKFFSIHGDPSSAAALAQLARDTYGFDAAIAERGTTVTI